MTTTATITCGPTLTARVEVLREINEMFTEVKVIEGRGGWDKPGKVLTVRRSIMSDVQAENTPAIAEPVTITSAIASIPVTAPISGDDYIEVLAARQAVYVAAHPHGPLPLLEWFIADGDERFVQLPETTPAPKRTSKPRVYRSAASIREELERIIAKRAAIGASDVPDRAVANLSPYARSKAAARAGRRRFEQTDRDLEKFTRLTQRIENLRMSLLMAEARESR